MTQFPPKLLNEGVLPNFLTKIDTEALQRFKTFFCQFITKDKTRRVYSLAIKRFIDWCDDRQLSLDDITHRDMENYSRFLSESFSDSTIRTNLAAIRSLFDWLMTGYIVPANPVSYFGYRDERGKDERAKRATPSSADTYKLVNGFGNKLIDLRDHAIACFLFYNFATPATICSVKYGDLSIKNSSEWITLTRTDGSQYDVPLQQQTKNALRSWISAAKENWQSADILFQSMRRGGNIQGAQLHPQDINRIMQSRAKKAGCSTRVNPLMLRAAGLAAYHANGGSLQKAQMLSGIRTPNWAELYTSESNIEAFELEGVFESFDSASDLLGEYINRAELFKPAWEEDK